MADLTKIRNLKETQLNEIAVGEIVLNVDAMTYVTKNSAGKVVPYDIIASLSGSIPKVYTATLTSVAEDGEKPATFVSTEVYNTLGTVGARYYDIGSYKLTGTKLFTVGKMVITPNAYFDNVFKVTFSHDDGDTITISALGGENFDVPTDGLLTNFPIKIEVYP